MFGFEPWATPRPPAPVIAALVAASCRCPPRLALRQKWCVTVPARIGQDETGLVSERRLRVGLVLEPTGIENPYQHGPYLGLERAVRELGIRGRVLTPAPKEGYVPSLSLLARQKYDLVIGTTSFAVAPAPGDETGSAQPA